MNSILEVNNLYKNYQNKDEEIKVLENINFKLKKGDFLGIVGPSGGGKSTLLSIISGLENKTSGNIIKDDNISFAYMLQEDTLMPFLNILDNCLLGLKIKKNYNSNTIKKVKEYLKKYGLKDYMYKYPKDLSGGQKQRASLIRALSQSPDILLLDEPFSKLDYQNRIKISNDVKNILKEENKSMIIVTHDISEAISLCSKVIVLSSKPTKIKSIYNINLNEDKDPIKNRMSDEFMNYYKMIWRDLNDE